MATQRRRTTVWVLAWALQALSADGGIAGLQTWFRRKFPSAFEPVGTPVQYEHVLVDMNQVLHHAVRKANDIEHAKVLVFMELNLQLQRCVPTRSVVLAFDGPAPRAKLLTQRRRRAKRKTAAGKLSSMIITPGSEFMREMHSACMYYACRRLQNEPPYRGVKFWISGSQVAGEGEVKIIDWLNCHLPLAPKGEPDTRSVCVIGSDVDLVLQCISALPRLMSGALAANSAAFAKRPKLSRAKQQRLKAAALKRGEGGATALHEGGASARPEGGAVAQQEGGAPAERFRFEVLTHSTTAKTHMGMRRSSVPWVRISVLELAGRLEQTFANCSASQVTHDLTALLCMFGNDYLPRLRGCTLTVLYDSYVQLRRSPEHAGTGGLIDDASRSFNIGFLRGVMRLLGARSHEIAHVSAKDLAEMRRATDEATVRGAVFAMKFKECVGMLALPERARYEDVRLAGERWGCVLHVGGKSFASDLERGHRVLKHAQWEAAKHALAELCPERYDAAVRSLEQAQRRLDRFAPPPAPPRAAPAAGVGRRAMAAGGSTSKVGDVDFDASVPVDVLVDDIARIVDDDDDGGPARSRDGGSGAQGRASSDGDGAARVFEGQGEGVGEEEDEDEDEDEDEEDASALGDEGESEHLYDPISYLRGVLWTLQMYIDGACPDYTYAYGARLAPSPAQISQCLDAMEDDEALRTLTPPLSHAKSPTPAAVLVCLVPIDSLPVVAPEVDSRISDRTREMVRKLQADEDRWMQSEMEAEQRAKESMLQSLCELMACAEADTLRGIKQREAIEIGAKCQVHWETVTCHTGTGPSHFPVPKPPTARSSKIRPYGLRMARVRATTKPPCRPWAR